MADIEQQIIAAEEQLQQAMLASDVTALDGLIAAELIFTNPLGQVLGKDDDLAAHRSGVMRFTRIAPSERQIRLVGNVAIVSVRVQMAGSYADTPFAGDLRATRVWHRTEAAGWQVVAGQISPIPQG
ncbi:hypothetical protein IGB42_00431 [Andreprevotia sp. IGB-42]|uniref:nuclear transport factor 2 family protein n=1 Tax=Andreprevotia sp. IGB-42 TaxID=2497473 RepID=UPI0013571508|nr:nuclear transport factor 2 family protein [Andreprevotia sp. IGB-42]KAF0815350.1 hypothetical protein IGB42_00431 [Andreprevotia sp. IGB-42]